jgi:2-dehydropantoate 2-reductase
MRIAVVGIGGVGGYIGAKLCTLKEQNPKKYDITFIARGAHANAVKKNGIRIVEDETSFTANASQVCEAEETQGTFDFILLCVKSYDIQKALMSLKGHIRPDTVIMPLANGIDNAERIKTLVSAKVINGSVYILSHIQEPGIIRKQGNVFAVVFGDEQYIGESLYIERIFNDANIRCKMVENIEEALWKKYLFISAFASLSSYFDMNIKVLYNEHYDLAKAVLEEIAAVAMIKGINLKDEIEKALLTASKLPEDATTSMHLDFQKGCKNELETLSGYIVNTAEKTGLSVPHMKKIYQSLRQKS